MARKLRCTPTWQLDDATLAPLLAAMHLGRRQVFRRGDFLYRQGEVTPQFYLILRGQVLIASTREDGCEFTLELMGHRTLCGEAAAFDGKPSFTSAQTLEDTEVMAFPVATVWAALGEHPSLAVALLRITASKQRIIAVRAQYLAGLKPEARIAELLLRLTEQHGTPASEGVSISLHLTHQQIASLTGTSRVTVTRVFKRLREQGVIVADGQRLRIPELPRLMAAGIHR